LTLRKVVEVSSCDAGQAEMTLSQIWDAEKTKEGRYSTVIVACEVSEITVVQIKCKEKSVRRLCEYLGTWTYLSEVLYLNAKHVF
jgi:hypothetical protein